jgi:hypothetical protein
LASLAAAVSSLLLRGEILRFAQDDITSLSILFQRLPGGDEISSRSTREVVVVVVVVVCRISGDGEGL